MVSKAGKYMEALYVSYISFIEVTLSVMLSQLNRCSDFNKNWHGDTLRKDLFGLITLYGNNRHNVGGTEG